MTVETGVLWRVCYHEAPLDLAPREMYSFRHRFDDIGRRFERCLLTSAPMPPLVDASAHQTLTGMHCDRL